MAKKKDKPKMPPMDDPDVEIDEMWDQGFDLSPEMLMGDFDENAFWQEPDFLLADIIHMMVNITGLEIGVTLFVKGMTLTGTLVSERQYLTDLGNMFRSRVNLQNNNNMSKEEREAFESMFDFSQLAETDIANDMMQDGTVPNGSSPIRFLHLKNPLLLGHGGVMDFAQGEAPYIRLRLTMIDGWMLGEAVTPDMFQDDDPSGQVLH